MAGDGAGFLPQGEMVEKQGIVFREVPGAGTLVARPADESGMNGLKTQLEVHGIRFEDTSGAAGFSLEVGREDADALVKRGFNVQALLLPSERKDIIFREMPVTGTLMVRLQSVTMPRLKHDLKFHNIPFGDTSVGGEFFLAVANNEKAHLQKAGFTIEKMLTSDRQYYLFDSVSKELPTHTRVKAPR